jgi:hypothetical protein
VIKLQQWHGSTEHCSGVMSEKGQFQTSARMKRMSASPPEADIASRAADVRNVPTRDIARLFEM